MAATGGEGPGLLGDEGCCVAAGGLGSGGGGDGTACTVGGGGAAAMLCTAGSQSWPLTALMLSCNCSNSGSAQAAGVPSLSLVRAEVLRQLCIRGRSNHHDQAHTMHVLVSSE